MNASGAFGEQVRAFGVAWVLLCIALALHVLDEALTDFLSVYNPTVQAIRQRFPFLPLPVFSFRVWLVGLCAAVLLALCLSPLAFRGSCFALGVSYPLAVVMFGNALGHIGASLYRRRLMPGTYSAPLLLFAAAHLFVCAIRVTHSN
jgi:hypothetical protein